MGTAIALLPPPVSLLACHGATFTLTMELYGGMRKKKRRELTLRITHIGIEN